MLGWPRVLAFGRESPRACLSAQHTGKAHSYLAARLPVYPRIFAEPLTLVAYGIDRRAFDSLCQPAECGTYVISCFRVRLVVIDDSSVFPRTIRCLPEVNMQFRGDDQR